MTDLKTQAIDAVEENANELWKLTALSIVEDLANSKQEFTTDDVWKKLDELPDVQTHEPRALGAVMRRAVRDGLIVSTSTHILSSRPSCHSRPIRVWKSTILENK